MIIEKFSRKMIVSRLFDTYVATAFFATLIYYVLNASLYTPLEMMIGVVLSTIVFKSFANLMLSMSISLVDLDKTQDAIEFEKSSNKLESLVSDLAIQEASVQSTKYTK
jgi:hypothetical protein